MKVFQLLLFTLFLSITKPNKLEASLKKSNFSKNNQQHQSTLPSYEDFVNSNSMKPNHVDQELADNQQKNHPQSPIKGDHFANSLRGDRFECLNSKEHERPNPNKRMQLTLQKSQDNSDGKR